MPWHIDSDHAECPTSEPFAVVKDDDGKVVGCHMSRDAAEKQMAALYANEGQPRSAEPVTYSRSWALDDIHILRAADGHGDGRTVEAYASVFDVPTEITDRYGHYFEVIDHRAFNRQLGLGIDRVGVYYHHGMTIHGTPSDLGSVPIGSPIGIRADKKGLRTVTRYNATPLAESVLEAIRHGDIKGYSFSGPVFKSNPMRVPRVSRSARIPTVTRLELGLAEYGPTPKPAYVEAGILAMRALQMIASTTPGQPDQETQFATSDPELGEAEDQRQRALRSAQLQKVIIDLAKAKERRDGAQEE